MDLTRLKVLLVEDDEDDYILTRDLFQAIEGTAFDLDWAPDFHQGLREVNRGCHDLYLFDYHLGSHTGLDLLVRSGENRFRSPVILLTGQGDRAVDKAATRSGAADFLVKGEITPALLERSIRYALERTRIEQKLARLASYDDLTGLPNRFLFNDRLQQALAAANRAGTQVAVLFLDLDRFKTVNDTLGHSAGDKLLRAVAKRLLDCVRGSDTVARLGGDELVVILTGMRESRVPAAVAGRILVAFVRPVQIDGHEIYTSPSIGIALYPFDGGDGESLLANADAAMYQAKASGGNGYKFFSVDMNTEARERLELESGLHRALERDEYRLHYQPQFTLAEGALSGVEALLRWQPRQGGLLKASRFLPLLEENGLICNVGEWVLRTACFQARGWRDAGLQPVRLAVNVSARQLRMPDLVGQVARILDETGLDPRSLELELVEGNLMQNLQETIETLRGLRGLGVHLVMDDFGQGFSSLNCLKYLPVEKVKIDKDFIRQIGLSSEDEAIIRAIVGMGHSLGLRVVAEGVETKGQLDFLRAHDCDEVQGYLFGRPQPPEDLKAMLPEAVPTTDDF